MVGTNGPVEFTKEGRRELARIYKELRKLRKEELSPADLDARLKALMERVRRVLDEELVPARERGDGDGDDDDEDEGDDEQFDETTTDETETTTTVETETDTVDTDTTETKTTDTTTTTTTP